MKHTDLPADELLSALVLAIPDLVFVVDSHGRYRAVMGGSDRTRYNAPTHLVGKRIHEAVPRGLADECMDAIHTSCASGMVQSFSYVLQDGDVSGLPCFPGYRRRHWFEARVSPIPDPAGNRAGAVIVVSNITEQVARQARLKQLSWEDELTGAANRKAFIYRATEMAEFCRRHGQCMAVAMIDIEQLAHVNRHCGLETGDALLPMLVNTLSSNTRISDVLTRIGDDEFALLMPCTDRAGARVAMNRLREVVRRKTFHCHAHEIRISFSAGIAAYTRSAAARALSKMLQEAEQSLKSAKDGGRGRIVCSPG